MGRPDQRWAVEKLVEDYYIPLYRYAFRLTGSASDADDLTQEAFCKAQANLSQLRDAARAKAWLFSILRNTYLHQFREERQQRVISLDGVGDLAEPTPEPLPEIDLNHLQCVLNKLPEVFRTPIILYYFEEFSYRDIAEQMDLPLGTVMSRLARAKYHLRTALLKTASPRSGGPGRATDGL